MKKLFALTLALMLALSLAACGEDNGGSGFTGVSIPTGNSTANNSTGESGTPSKTQPPESSGTPAASKPPASGGIDPALIGVWEDFSLRWVTLHEQQYRYEIYSFFDDGTFKYTPYDSDMLWSGTYTVTDGKLNLKPLIRTQVKTGATEDLDWVVDKTMEYKIVEEEGIKYLNISSMRDYSDKPYVGMIQAMKYRKTA